jgi:hypothetical protein
MVGVLFYLRSDGQYMLLGDTGMAVCFVDYYAVIIQNKNTAMIVSLTKIYCPFELKQKRTPTVYRNVTEFNDVLIDIGRPFLFKVK